MKKSGDDEIETTSSIVSLRCPVCIIAFYIIYIVLYIIYTIYSSKYK